MRNTATTIILLILSVILIKTNITSILNNPVKTVVMLTLILIITIVTTYLSSTLIIPLAISIIPFIININNIRISSSQYMIAEYYNVFNVFKNSIMLIGVLSVIMFKVIVEKKLPHDPLLSIKQLLENTRSTSMNKRSLTIIMAEIFVLLGTLFYMAYIITSLIRDLSEFYISGILVSVITSTMAIISNIPLTASVLIAVSSWFSPLVFLSLLSDLSSKIEEVNIPKRGVYLGKIKAKLKYMKGTISKYDFSVTDRHISIKEQWEWTKVNTDFYYDPNLHENPHILIVGSSGTGKSTLATVLSHGLHVIFNSSILIIDFHGEYKRLFEKIFPEIDVNILNTAEKRVSLFDILSGHNIKEKSLEIASIIQRIFNLGPLQRIYLQKIIEEAYTIIHELKDSENRALLEAYNLVLDNVQTDQELRSVRSLEPYIRTLAQEFFGEETIPIDRLFSTITIVDLSPLYSEYFKNLYAELLLLKIYDNLLILSRQNNNMKYLVVDEAHRIAGDNKNILAKIVAESRKYKIGVIVLTQHPKSVSEDIVGNTSLQIVLQLREPQNLEYSARLLAGYQADNRLDIIRKALYYLPRFHGLVKDSLIREPLLIDFTRKLGGKNG